MTAANSEGPIDLPKSREFVSSTLDRLDGFSSNDTHANRHEERFKYRVRELTVEFSDGHGAWRTHACASRNISANGIGVIVGNFVYPGTVCRVTLVSLHNHRALHTGKVMRCRYLPGTVRLHEVGIKFDSPINVGMFHRGATPTHVLVADDDKAIHKLIDSLLKEEHVVIASVFDGKSALEFLQGKNVDVALIDLNMPQLDGFEVARKARQLGIGTPLVAITVSDESETRAPAMEAGFDLWLGKPLTKSSLATVIRNMKSEQIISTLIHDRNMTEIIDGFVLSVDARLVAIQKALAEADWNSLALQLRTIRADSASAGFEMVANAAIDTLSLFDKAPEMLAVRSKLLMLTRLMRAAMGASCKATLGGPLLTGAILK